MKPRPGGRVHLDERMEEGNMNWHPLIQHFISTFHLPESSEIRQLSNQLFQNSEVLFYPSSGADLSDIKYFNSYRVPALENNNPNIFIHNDGMGYHHSLEIDLDPFAKTNIVFNDRSKNNTQLIIAKFQPQNQLVKEGWLIMFFNSLNEEFLKLSLKTETKIKYLFTSCDGITTGMGGINETSISTIFYPYLSKYWETNFIITEYGWDFINDFVQNDDYRKNAYQILDDLLFETIGKRLDQLPLKDIYRPYPASKINSPRPQFLGRLIDPTLFKVSRLI